MKIDFRIMGRPYRCSSRTMILDSGYPTREAALTVLKKEIDAGAMDPFAWVQAKQVSDKWRPKTAPLKISVYSSGR